MKNITGNLWDQECDALVITTNGFVKTNGEAVMGRGCAKEACNLIPGLAATLGRKLAQKGNAPFVIGTHKERRIVSFPVKPAKVLFNDANVVVHMKSRFKVGDIVPGWAAKAELHIITHSANILVAMADTFGWQKIVLPRPGCGAGELDWAKVEPILSQILDDRFYCITFGNGGAA